MKPDHSLAFACHRSIVNLDSLCGYAGQQLGGNVAIACTYRQWQSVLYYRGANSSLLLTGFLHRTQHREHACLYYE